jgi:hypothetical protein
MLPPAARKRLFSQMLWTVPNENGNQQYVWRNDASTVWNGAQGELASTQCSGLKTGSAVVLALHEGKKKIALRFRTATFILSKWFTTPPLFPASPLKTSTRPGTMQPSVGIGESWSHYVHKMIGTV